MCISRHIIVRVKSDVPIQSDIKQVVYDLGFFYMNLFRHDIETSPFDRPVTWKNRRRGLGEPLLA